MARKEGRRIFGLLGHLSCQARFGRRRQETFDKEKRKSERPSYANGAYRGEPNVFTAQSHRAQSTQHERLWDGASLRARSSPVESWVWLSCHVGRSSSIGLGRRRATVGRLTLNIISYLAKPRYRGFRQIAFSYRSPDFGASLGQVRDRIPNCRRISPTRAEA